MKKCIYSLIYFCLFSNITLAQIKPFLAFSGSVFANKLSNKQDTKADERLDFKPSAGSEYGLSVGLQYRKENSNWMFGLSTGYKLCNINQHYKGSITQLYSLPDTMATWTFKAYTSLGYHKIPVSVSVSKKVKNKWNIILSGGLYVAKLKGAKDYFESDYPKATYKGKIIVDNLDYMTEIDIERNSFYQIERATMNQGYYKSTDWGGTASAGISYLLDKHVELCLDMNYSRGFTDIENKNNITFHYKEPVEFFNTRNPWADLQAKILPYGTPIKPNTVRPSTKVVLGV